MAMTAVTALCAALVLAGAAPSQQHETHLPSPPPAGKSTDEFSLLFPSRVKTFVKAGYDPDDRPFAANQGNDDGFSGRNLSESYRTTEAGNPFAVLAHFEGRPGALGLFFRNFWSDFAGAPMYPGENNRTWIWLDDQLAHDMPLADFFRNENDPRQQIPPFAGPFTGNRSGGYLTHAQLRWTDRFKIGLFDDGFHNAARFHRIAATLGTPEGEVPVADMADWTRVARARGFWPHAAERVPQFATLTIPVAGTQRLQLTGPATILELSCRVGAHADWQHLWARFTWDGQTAPAVDLPLRLLGGMICPPYRFPVAGLMFGNDGNRVVRTFMPMHFASGAQLEFVNRGPGPISLHVTLAQVPGAHARPWGYFTALHRAGTTGTGETFFGPRIENARGLLRCLMLEDTVDNTGRISNVLLNHLEGDLCVRINGNRGEDHSFDASETSIGRWGWYLSPADRPFVQDTSFQSTMILRALPGNHHEGRRLQGSLFVFDPIHFVNGIDLALEHGVQNTSNADYGLTALLYVEPGAARRTIAEVDVGNPTSELQHQVQFTQWSNYTRAGAFFRDHFFGSSPISDSVRHVRDFLRFRVVRTVEAEPRPVGVGFRLDRLGTSASSVCQADVFVDGVRAGLLHCFTHSSVFPWKEGGECEVELPRRLTDGKATFVVEVRPRTGSDPVRIARAWVHEYVK
jgi:hypothetical protein